MKYQCPVCLNDSLDKPYERYSYDICRVCGVEYGFDDVINESGFTSEDWGSKADVLIAANHNKLRQIWIDAGSLNWWEETEKPDFKGGVSWFDEYLENNPLEKDKMDENLVSIFLKAKDEV